MKCRPLFAFFFSGLSPAYSRGRKTTDENHAQRCLSFFFLVVARKRKYGFCASGSGCHKFSGSRLLCEVGQYRKGAEDFCVKKDEKNST